MPESADEDLNNIDYELSPIFNAVNRDSERIAVLVAAAHLSELLRRLIQGYLIDNGGTKDLFSGPTAALSSFSARASAAFALGLISPDEFRCLTLVRRIRNAFAHEVRASFLDVYYARHQRTKSFDYKAPRGGPRLFLSACKLPYHFDDYATQV